MGYLFHFDLPRVRVEVFAFRLKRILNGLGSRIHRHDDHGYSIHIGDIRMKNEADVPDVAYSIEVDQIRKYKDESPGSISLFEFQIERKDDSRITIWGYCDEEEYKGEFDEILKAIHETWPPHLYDGVGAAKTQKQDKSAARMEYGPNSSTLRKIEKLRDMCRVAIQQRPNWTAACDRVGIDSATAQRHAPELRSGWDDPNYSPD